MSGPGQMHRYILINKAKLVLKLSKEYICPHTAMGKHYLLIKQQLNLIISPSEAACNKTRLVFQSSVTLLTSNQSLNHPSASNTFPAHLPITSTRVLLSARGQRSPHALDSWELEWSFRNLIILLTIHLSDKIKETR